MAPRMASFVVFIETLTGTEFEVRVSPYETIMSLKARIQRAEGISISQQHLLYNSQELDNEAKIRDYNIKEGATLKLVLAMRGGPVNMRRVQLADDAAAIFDVKQFLEINRSDLWGDVPSGLQVTLLVFRDGDQVNFYRVTENNDGGYSPLQDSWSGNSIRNLFADDDEEWQAKLQENKMTEDKVKLLQKAMSKRKTGRTATPARSWTEQVLNASFSSSVDLKKSSDRRRQALNNSLTSAASLARRRMSMNHADVSGESSSSNPITYRSPSESLSSNPLLASYLEQQASINKPTKPSHSLPNIRRKKKVIANNNRLSESLRTRTNSQNNENLLFRYPEGKETNDIKTRQRNSKKILSPINKKATLQITDKPSVKESNNKTELPILKERNRRPKTSPVSHFNWVRATSPALSTQSDTSFRYASEEKGRQLCSILKPIQEKALREPGDALRQQESIEARVARDLFLELFADRDLRARSISRSTFRRGLGGMVAAGNRKTREQIRGVIGNIPKSAGKRKSSPLPPVPSKPRKPRCSQCGKKLGLATTFSCHCNKVFCSQHRYAEMHDCSYDYKHEGRKLIERANPVVTAQKLPKI